MRKLATIQKIYDIKPIEGRDRVDQAKILGWTVIVGKGQYQENEKVVFCEIDSLFPKTEDWVELEKFKYRIKTFKVNTPDGPIYGQGYCFPLSKLYDILDKKPTYYGFFNEVGLEVTEILGITKYESPDPSNNSMLMGNAAGAFPTQYIPKTDEIRLESCLEVLEEIKGQPYVITMKMDGTSWTGLKIDDEYVVCSRNNMLKNPKDSDVKSNYWDMFYQYPGIASLLDQGFGLQAEMCGEGIQKNRMGIKGKALAAFNIFDLKTRKYVDSGLFFDLCEEYDIPRVNIIDHGYSFNLTFEDLKKMADELKYNSGQPAEGIVIRSMKEQYSRVLQGRMSFKQISRVFLAKGGD